MNYISLFSGIEAASVAWEPLGWNPVAFSEIDPFCCDLLEKRFPDVPNLGDISGVDWTEYEGSVDVVIGGSPCQAFSMAGRRLGLMDERGQLMLEFVRCVREVGPRWVVWENVPGVLSQDKGRAFGTLLGELEDCGYALAWRVLDAQFFGVPQRRRRVFLVGHPVPGCAAGVLFEPDCMRGDNPPSREKRAQLAADAEMRAGGGHPLKLTQSMSVAYAISGNVIGRDSENGGNHLGIEDDGAMFTLTTADRHAVAFTWNQDTGFSSASECAPTLRAARCGEPAVAITQYGEEIDGTLTARSDSSPCIDRRMNIVCMATQQGGSEIAYDLCPTITSAAGTSGNNQPVVCMSDGNAHAAVDQECAGTLKVGGEPPIVVTEYIVRRLMPVECERLQGFPDGWTDLGGTPDAPRYRACGNSMAVPVINHIGRRIEAVDAVF